MRVPAILLALSAASMSSGCVAVAVAGAGMVAVQDRSIGRAIDDTSAAGQVKARLMALDGAALEDLHRAGHLLALFMAAASLSQLGALVDRQNLTLGDG